MPKKILVIEDDHSLRRMFKSMLLESGFEVEVAENGKVGLEKIEIYKPDLIMLDIMMPVMDGFEVLKNLKSDDKGRTIPVIVLTNLDQEKDEETAKILGADGFLMKNDVHLTELLEKINEQLRK